MMSILPRIALCLFGVIKILLLRSNWDIYIGGKLELFILKCPSLRDLLLRLVRYHWLKPAVIKVLSLRDLTLKIRFIRLLLSILICYLGCFVVKSGKNEVLNSIFRSALPLGSAKNFQFITPKTSYF